jgi:hypothetical protein
LALEGKRQLVDVFVQVPVAVAEQMNEHWRSDVSVAGTEVYCVEELQTVAGKQLSWSVWFCHVPRVTSSTQGIHVRSDVGVGATF